MGRKRLEKKRSKRLTSARDRLEGLVGREAWEELVTAVHASPDDALTPELEACYLRAVDHRLRGLLSHGDVGGVRRLLSMLGSRCSDRPLASAARAVIALQDGDRDLARRHLEPLETAASGATGSPVPEVVVEGLHALCRTPAAPSRGRPLRSPAESRCPLVGDLRRLEGALTRLDDRNRAGGSASMPPPLRLEDENARAAWSLVRALAAIEGGERHPTRTRVAAVVRAVSKLRGLSYGAGEVAVILGRLDELSVLLAELACELEAMERTWEGLRPSMLQEDLRSGRWAALERVFGEPGASSGPERILRVRALAVWRSILQTMLEGGEAEAVAALRVAHSALLAPVIRLTATAAMPPLQHVAGRAAALRLLAEERLGDLAEMLARSSQRESDPARRATLWALELDLRWRHADETEDLGDEAIDDSAAALALDEFIGRLLEIIAEVRGLPHTQRAGVARVLRGYLVRLSQKMTFDETMGYLAAGLLSFIPNDATLLTAAFVAFRNEEMEDETDALRQLLPGAAHPAEDEIEELGALLYELAAGGCEDDETVVEGLTLLRPLLGDADWLRTVAPMAAEVARETAFLLGLVPSEDRDGYASDLIERIAPFFEGLPELDAIRTVAAVRSDPKRARAKCDAYLESNPGVEGALVLVGLMTAAGMMDGARAERQALERIARWTINALDSRWERWHDQLPVLLGVVGGSPRLLGLFIRKMDRLAADGELPATLRTLLENLTDVMLNAIPDLLGAPDGTSGRNGRRPGRTSRGGARKADTTDRQLSLDFEVE